MEGQGAPQPPDEEREAYGAEEVEDVEGRQRDEEEEEGRVHWTERLRKQEMARRWCPSNPITCPPCPHPREALFYSELLYGADGWGCSECQSASPSAPPEPLDGLALAVKAHGLHLDSVVRDERPIDPDHAGRAERVGAACAGVGLSSSEGIAEAWAIDHAG